MGKGFDFTDIAVILIVMVFFMVGIALDGWFQRMLLSSVQNSPGPTAMWLRLIYDIHGYTFLYEIINLGVGAGALKYRN